MRLSFTLSPVAVAVLCACGNVDPSQLDAAKSVRGAEVIGASCSSDAGCGSTEYCSNPLGSSQSCAALPAQNPPPEYSNPSCATAQPPSSCTCAYRLTDNYWNPNGKVDVQTIYVVDYYVGVQTNSTTGAKHEIAYGHVDNTQWQFDPGSVQSSPFSQIDASYTATGGVKIALNVYTSAEPYGLPYEIPLVAGQTVGIEGEWIDAAAAKDAAATDAMSPYCGPSTPYYCSVLHFSHSPCGYVNINGSVYQ